MEIRVYYEPWVRQYVAFCPDLVDVETNGIVAWGNTAEDAINELKKILENKNKED